MALYIARHGQTDWNASGRYQARTDVPINSTGRMQASLLHTLFDTLGLDFRRAHSSPLSRATETAGILLADSKTELSVESSFLEMDLGEWEGRHTDDLIAEFGDGYHQWRDNGYVTAPHGGETIFDVIERVKPRVEQLAAGSDRFDILIVAHQATNMGIKASLSGDTSAETLRWYRQGNHEVDVWDNVSRSFKERLTVDVEENPDRD